MWLIEDEIHFAQEVQLTERLREALRLQADRMLDESDSLALSRRISDRVTKALEGALDADLQAPTAAQVAFARAVSAKLGIPLPQEALLYRKDLGIYLDKYLPRFKALSQSKR